MESSIMEQGVLILHFQQLDCCEYDPKRKRYIKLVTAFALIGLAHPYGNIDKPNNKETIRNHPSC